MFNTSMHDGLTRAARRTRRHAATAPAGTPAPRRTARTAPAPAGVVAVINAADDATVAACVAVAASAGRSDAGMIAPHDRIVGNGHTVPAYAPRTAPRAARPRRTVVVVDADGGAVSRAVAIVPACGTVVASARGADADAATGHVINALRRTSRGVNVRITRGGQPVAVQPQQQERQMSEPFSVELIRCTPGTQFVLDLHTMRGTFELIRVNECRARIRAVTATPRTFTTADGTVVNVGKRATYDVAPTMSVTPINLSATADRTQQEVIMSNTTKRTATVNAAKRAAVTAVTAPVVTPTAPTTRAARRAAATAASHDAAIAAADAALAAHDAATARRTRRAAVVTPAVVTAPAPAAPRTRRAAVVVTAPVTDAVATAKAAALARRAAKSAPVVTAAPVVVVPAAPVVKRGRRAATPAVVSVLSELDTAPVVTPAARTPRTLRPASVPAGRVTNACTACNAAPAARRGLCAPCYRADLRARAAGVGTVAVATPRVVTPRAARVTTPAVVTPTVTAPAAPVAARRTAPRVINTTPAERITQLEATVRALTDQVGALIALQIAAVAATRRTRRA